MQFKKIDKKVLESHGIVKKFVALQNVFEFFQKVKIIKDLTLDLDQTVFGFYDCEKLYKKYGFKPIILWDGVEYMIEDIEQSIKDQKYILFKNKLGFFK